MENLEGYIFITAMVIGQIYGFYFAIKNWNNKEVSGVTIFYAVTTYWILSIFVIGLSPLILMYFLYEGINKLRGMED
tara:strand:- start:503 stop:733 length:231 start_codon:yes stop_codon:yes gene_type:complete